MEVAELVLLCSQCVWSAAAQTTLTRIRRKEIEGVMVILNGMQDEASYKLKLPRSTYNQACAAAVEDQQPAADPQRGLIDYNYLSLSQFYPDFLLSVHYIKASMGPLDLFFQGVYKNTE